MTIRKLRLSATLCSLLAMPSISSFAIDTASLEFATGNKTQMVRAGAQWNWSDKWLESNGNHIGGYWEATVAGWRGNQYNNVKGQSQTLGDIGFTPVFRWQNDSRRGWYGEAAVGIHLHSQVYNNNGRRFSTAFQFGDHIGIGYVTDDGWDIAFKVQHFSNGAIKRPNPGVNFAVLKVGKKF